MRVRRRQVRQKSAVVTFERRLQPTYECNEHKDSERQNINLKDIGPYLDDLFAAKK